MRLRHPATNSTNITPKPPSYGHPRLLPRLLRKLMRCLDGRNRLALRWPYAEECGPRNRLRGSCSTFAGPLMAPPSLIVRIALILPLPLSHSNEKKHLRRPIPKSAGFDLGIFIAGRYLPGSIVPGQSIVVLLAWGFWGPG